MKRFLFISGIGGKLPGKVTCHEHLCHQVFCRDNYGFVAFRYKVDAYEAVEHGNDDPSLPKVDLCFGGRRAFCKEKYSDLGIRNA